MHRLGIIFILLCSFSAEASTDNESPGDTINVAYANILGIDWQRVGMGYMWGDGIESITFNLGFPF